MRHRLEELRRQRAQRLRAQHPHAHGLRRLRRRLRSRKTPPNRARRGRARSERARRASATAIARRRTAAKRRSARQQTAPSAATPARTPTGRTRCAQRRLHPACDAGFGSCDSNTANGCETSTRTLTDCNVCGVTCDVPNSNETCATGTCTATTCATGFAECVAGAPNCETPLGRRGALPFVQRGVHERARYDELQSRDRLRADLRRGLQELRRRSPTTVASATFARSRAAATATCRAPSRTRARPAAPAPARWARAIRASPTAAPRPAAKRSSARTRTARAAATPARTRTAERVLGHAGLVRLRADVRRRLQELQRKPRRRLRNPRQHQHELRELRASLLVPERRRVVRDGHLHPDGLQRGLCRLHRGGRLRNGARHDGELRELRQRLHQRPRQNGCAGMPGTYDCAPTCAAGFAQLQRQPRRRLRDRARRRSPTAVAVASPVRSRTRANRVRAERLHPRRVRRRLRQLRRASGERLRNDARQRHALQRLRQRVHQLARHDELRGNRRRLRLRSRVRRQLGQLQRQSRRRLRSRSHDHVELRPVRPCLQRRHAVLRAGHGRVTTVRRSSPSRTSPIPTTRAGA